MKQNEPSRVLRAIAREHVPEDVNLLPGILARVELSRQPARRPKRKLVAAFVLVFLAFILVLTRTQEIATAMRLLLGYIPGMGVIVQGAPIRVLAQPVSVTRGSITVSVNRAILTTTRTLIDYGISGVPLSAYPKEESSTAGCNQNAYLRLPDGSKIELTQPIPDNVNEAQFVLPCIFNTLSGSVPVDWELPLKFVPASPEMTVMPVLETSPTLPPPATLPAQNPTKPGATSTPVASQPLALTVDMAIPTSDGYILIGAIRVQDPSLSGYRLRGTFTLRDANGKKVNYTFPPDIEPAGLLGVRAMDAFALQFQAAGVAFPLTVEIPGALLAQPDTQSTAEFTMDTGVNPLRGQEWALDQDMELAGYAIHLSSIRVGAWNNYSFTMNVPQVVDSVRVEVKGLTSAGHGEASYSQGQIGTSVAFKELPKGKLTFVFSDLVKASETQTWQTQWQPETLTAGWPTATPPAEPICLSGDTIRQVTTAESLPGQALLTQTGGETRLVLASLDGSQRRELPAINGHGAFSPDGQKVAFPRLDGISILDLSTNASIVLKDATESDMLWSPDGSLIAYVSSTDLYGMYVAPVSGSAAPKQLSNLGYELLAGWSADGRLVYYAIPGPSNDESFVLRGVDVASGVTQDILTIDNLARKSPLLKVSPDGKWVAYRVNKTNSLYIRAMDGKSPERLLVSDPGMTITGIAWEKKSSLLGVSLLDSESQDGAVLLLKPSSCEAYRLPGLDGELIGLYMP